ncbi:hypothetical protein CLIM01_09853 [Colletotrichum limetticola]|uniref:SKP1 component POZ domain-containing protein n=1 Tax=Colletotrichum limetticola TaxID=1209924 RepID=A0ABQ9PML0_9PEZI|nr:hypothetical protein CLIM01_09853 [Colletotrichum limetticola]
MSSEQSKRIHIKAGDGTEFAVSPQVRLNTARSRCARKNHLSTPFAATIEEEEKGRTPLSAPPVPPFGTTTFSP